MKIKQLTFTDETGKFDFRQGLKIEVDGQVKMSFLDGEPEDANIGRDFKGVNNILDLVVEAFEAGQQGKELLINHVNVTDLNKF